MNESLLILAQGSPLRSNDLFISCVWELLNRMTTFQCVELGYTDGDVDCYSAVGRLSQCGVRSVVIAPLFLFNERVEKRKTMEIFGKLCVLYPDINFKLADSVGADIQIAGLLAQTAQKAIASEGLLCGRFELY